MSIGHTRFGTYLDKLGVLFTEAEKQADPGLWLYQNNARTVFFMLEGLARLYSGLTDYKGFEKIEKHAKQVEDALGSVDYYDGFAKEFGSEKGSLAKFAEFAHRRANEKTADLNQLLIDKKWAGPKAKRIGKIKKRLKKAPWPDEKDEIKSIESFYRDSIKKIDKFAGNYEGGFTELESQVHELRRKLRWLSIYPQALQGAIQLTVSSPGDPILAKYLTPEIVNSPFNKMPDRGNNAYVLLLDQERFYALSWMIAELGKLKDKGLRRVVTNEADKRVTDGDAGDAQILEEASAICRTYFDEQSLDKLIIGLG